MYGLFRGFESQSCHVASSRMRAIVCSDFKIIELKQQFRGNTQIEHTVLHPPPTWVRIMNSTKVQGLKLMT